jgi:hypothetical protein
MAGIASKNLLNSITLPLDLASSMRILNPSLSLRFMTNKMMRARDSPKKRAAVCVSCLVLACMGGRSICRIVPRKPSACSGTCRLTSRSLTYRVDGSRDDHQGYDGRFELLSDFAHRMLRIELLSHYVRGGARRSTGLV